MNNEITPGEINRTNKEIESNKEGPEVTKKREEEKVQNDKTKEDEYIFRVKKDGVEVSAKNITEKTIILTVVILLFITFWIVLLKF